MSLLHYYPMQKEIALIFSWLNFLTKKRYDALVSEFGSLEAALPNLNQQVLKSLGCQEETQYIILNRLEEFDSAAYAKELEKRGIALISIEDPEYPVSLQTIADPPVFLYAQGCVDILKQPCIGCVGTRNMSSYGKRVVEDFVPAFIRSGMVTVSGLALGIDAKVAEESMHANGKTVAVLGSGLAGITPAANKAIGKKIVEEGGLILSEYPLDHIPDKYSFPARNRIIAGLSLATVVFEAGEGSGSLITADLALQYSRDVCIVPGPIYDPNYVGSNQAISNGIGQLVTSADEVLEGIGIVGPSAESTVSSTFIAADREEQTVYDLLTSMPQSVSDITEKAKIDAAITNAKLTMLELQGRAKNVGNGMWVAQ